MKKLTSLLLVVILSLTLANQPIYAWNAHGHRVIASIAFMRLEPYRQLEIANRIRKHPRWDQDFAAKMPEVVKDGDEQVQAEGGSEHADGAVNSQHCPEMDGVDADLHADLVEKRCQDDHDRGGVKEHADDEHSYVHQEENMDRV